MESSFAGRRRVRRRGGVRGGRVVGRGRVRRRGGVRGGRVVWRGRVRRRGGVRGGRVVETWRPWKNRAKFIVSKEILATLVDHVVNHGSTLSSAQPQQI